VSAGEDIWARTALAVACLSVDPAGLGGIWIRARSGPVRDRLLAGIVAGIAPLPTRRLHPNISDEQLFGGVDLAASLSKGGLVRSTGLLGQPAALILPMAERATAGLSARLSMALDAGAGHTLIALDEGAEPEERLAGSLADRLALHVDLDALAMGDCPALVTDAETITAARAAMHGIRIDDAALQTLTRLAARLGITSLRAPLLALRVARASAALMGEDEVTEDDLTLAAELVLAPRATVLPEAETEPAPPNDPPPPESEGEQTDSDEDDNTPLPIPEDILLEAIKAILPADLLAQLAATKAPRRVSAAGGTGAAKRGNRRGRPLPSRPGALGGDQRIDMVATLRAAAPWQAVRAKQSPHRTGLHIRADDIRIRQFEEKSDRLLIFAVDASGSAAMSRLAEAKGAIELLLAEAYARRDQVALVSFRGDAAEVLLPPTRSLVQTKRRLSALAGGGGTPLAAGLRVAMDLADLTRGRGMTPSIAIITDGRANVALDGTANRAQAGEDAQMLARIIAARGTPVLVIDIGNRPQPGLKALADTMRATYLPLPRADARRLSTAVTAALEP
jgi:magnesium chelatase subunit D